MPAYASRCRSSEAMRWTRPDGSWHPTVIRRRYGALAGLTPVQAIIASRSRRRQCFLIVDKGVDGR